MYEHIDLVKIWRLKMGKNELEIYFYLKDHTDLNHPIKVGDLKKKLGDSSDRHTFKKKLHSAILLCGKDKIRYTGELDGRLGKIWYNQPLNVERMNRLLQAIDCSPLYENSEEKEEMKKVLKCHLQSEKYKEQKLDSDVQIVNTIERRRGYYLQYHHNEWDLVHSIQEAIDDEYAIKCDLMHRTSDGKYTTYRKNTVISPYRLIMYDNHYYMIGLWDRNTGENKKNTIRVFDLRKISCLSLATTKSGTGRYRRSKKCSIIMEKELSQMKDETLFRNQICFDNLDKMEKLCKVPEFRFKAKNMDDAIYDTFGTKCCKYEDEIYTVKCSEQFFIKWVMGYVDSVELLDEISHYVKETIQRRLKEAIKNWSD